MWRDLLTAFLGGIAELTFPNSCWICDRSELDDALFQNGLCPGCFHEVTQDPDETCPHCAATVGPFTDTSAGCTACRGRGFAFEGVVRLGPYSGRLQAAILRMKHGWGEGLADLMGRTLTEVRREGLIRLGANAVIPIPLYRFRRWRRGYNQGEAMAREIATGLNLPLLTQSLRRVTQTAQHLQPSATARRESIRGAFSCHADASLKGRTILLVDDVMTTGSTLNEAARTIKAAGAVRVVATVLARV